MHRRIFHLLLILAVFAPLALFAGAAHSQSIQTSAPIAYLYDVGTASPLFEKKADEPSPPASLVKLLTAETVFHALKTGDVSLETEYPITEAVWRKGGAPAGAAAMFAPLNSRVSISNLLQGLIVQSANDAALALADGIAGNETAFVARMQERARAIGLTRSQFRNATGYAHPEQRVTAREMASLARHLIEAYPEYFPLFGQGEFTWNNIRQTNRNPLVRLNIGADGMKTGNLAESGYNIVGSAQRDGRRLIVVVMGAESADQRLVEARKLLEWGFSNFERRKLIEGGAVLAEAKVSGGAAAQTQLGLRDDISLLMPKSALDSVTATITYQAPLRAPIAAGAEVGRLTVQRGTTVALQVPVIALESVAEGSLGKRALDNSWDWIASQFRRSGKS